MKLRTNKQGKKETKPMTIIQSVVFPIGARVLIQGSILMIENCHFPVGALLEKS